MNGNSVLNQALDARVKNKLGEIQDQARIIYSDLLIKKFKGDNDKISLIDVVTELRKQGYEIEAREVVADAVKGITASPSELILNKNETGKIRIKYDGSDDGNLYYAKVEGKYYKIKMDETTLEVERNASNPEGTVVTATLEVVDDYEKSIVTNAQINGNEITITSGDTEGNTTITIKYGEKTTTCEVEVATKVTEITLNKTTETVVTGKTITLTSTVKPDDATNKNVTWNSSNPAVATVNDTGVVTGLTVGTVTITATAADGSGITSNVCTITVREPIMSDVVDKVFSTTSNTTVKDKNKNKIVIPAGFKVVANGGTDNASKVTYSYNGDGTPAVQDGIVVQDGSGNQFVWVPCRHNKK